MSFVRTYRCLVDVVHVGGSSAACPDGVLEQRKEVLSSSGQDTGPISGGFYSQSLALSGPSLGGPASPLFVPHCVSMNVCLCMCVIWPICHNHRAQIKMQQLLGGILWSGMKLGVGVGGGCLVSREGARETLNIPLDLNQRHRGLRRLCVRLQGGGGGRDAASSQLTMVEAELCDSQRSRGRYEDRHLTGTSGMCIIDFFFNFSFTAFVLIASKAQG